uniref:UDP-glucuronosyltransferase n=1 Tax=Dendroctonus ponderosae TaxID=77166 RepID=A0AAR5PJR7_DENPD
MLLRGLPLILMTLELCGAANILAMFPLPGLSHFVMFRALLKELAQRGHNVDVFSHFPLEKPIKGYHDIDLRGSSPLLTNNMTFDVLRDEKGVEFAKLMSNEAGFKICEDSFKATQLKQLKTSRKKYDLLLTELFGSDCMLGWAWHFKVPTIVMTSSANLPWAADRFGLPDNPSYIPTYFMGSVSKQDFFGRMMNTWTLIRSKMLYRLHSTIPSNKLAKEFFGPEMPDLDVLAYNTSLQLVNSHFSVNNARPLVPNVVEVGGLHVGEPRPLSKHFDDVLAADKRGIEIIESLPRGKLEALLNALAELPYTVIMKANVQKFPKDIAAPKNIVFEPWIPQLDILCDPRVKLFISHGGMMGTQEAVYCGIPVLGIPIFADQSLNIKYTEAMGFGIMVDYEKITKETLVIAAGKLLEDPKYRANAQRLSAYFKDRPMKPMDTAVYWVEYIVRHQGAPILQSAAKDLAWYQYYLIDVAAFLMFFSALLASIVAKVFVLLRNLGAKKKTKTS